MYNSIIMDYTYIFEEEANKQLSYNELVEMGINVLNILCYNINTSGKYPFIQFLLEKIPYCSHLIEEQFTLPIMFLQNENIQEQSLSRVGTYLTTIGCSGDLMCDDMYKGVVYLEKQAYVLVNITGLDVNYLYLSRNSLYWFALPTEIINTQSICNIGISDEVSYIFRNNLDMSIIHKSDKNEHYNLPDVVYYGNEYRKVEFNGIFLNSKERIYDSCPEYYYFYKSFNDAVKSGGWCKEVFQDKNDLVENEYGRYINGGINRVVVFTDNFSYHIEESNKFSLTEDKINELSENSCISICYQDSKIVEPDLLVKSYDNLFPLSYHKLDKKTLGNKYDKKYSTKYMIL